MRSSIGLRTKLYLLILPLILVVVLLSGVLSSLAARSVLVPIATRLLAYKAEQLRDYAYSEWEALGALGLSETDEYRAAAEESFRSYATSLLRTESEMILVVDDDGRSVMVIGAAPPADSAAPAADARVRDLSLGWFSGDLLGEDRVGVVFRFDPYGWRVAVTERQAVFFTESQAIVRTHIGISLVATIATIALVWVFVGYVVRPIERLSATISDVERTRDLSRRVDVEFADEVGLLGAEFNRMISSLEANYSRLEAAIDAETQARELAIAREEETLLLLGRVSDFRDKETAKHLERIGTYTGLLSRLLGHMQEQTDLLRRASALHDIGKVAVSDTILLKPGKLTPEEYRAMQQHTVFGYELLKDSKSAYLVKGAEIALTHHEKWDGSGYPKGLVGTDIPLSGRIVAVVDVFDALTSERPYKAAWTPEAARDLIVSERGRHFDPDLVDTFLANFELFREMMG